MYEKEIRGKSKRGTFLVNINCCENATWQGYVVWAEENRREYFQSALQLLNIINNALDGIKIEQGCLENQKAERKA